MSDKTDSDSPPQNIKVVQEDAPPARERKNNQDGNDSSSEGGRQRQGRRRGGPVKGRVRGRGGNNRRGRNSGGGGRRERERDPDEHRERKPVELTGPEVKVGGLLEIAPKGFGFLRVPDKDYEQSRDDVFVPPDLVRTHGLRVGVWIEGLAREGSRGMQLTEVKKVNGDKPEKTRGYPAFEELKAINPCKRIAFETDGDRHTTRIIDLFAPIGRGQRGLIVSPPRSCLPRLSANS